MKYKILQIILILSIILLFSTSYVLATDVNLYLPEINPPRNNINSNNVENSNNQQTNENLLNNETRNQNNSQIVNNNDNNINNVTAAENLQPVATNSAPQSGLGITNIINILLITVGFVLILLAIAIIIRIK